MSSKDSIVDLKAQEMGRKGGAARAKALSPERRREIGKKANAARKCNQ